ncbi:MAG: MAPEG family protein [Ramlibacter sp.]
MALQTFETYHVTLAAMTLAALLLVVQLIIADLTAIRSRHKAGYPIPADSKTFLFRSARAHTNTNESISAFVLLATVGVLSSAPPGALGFLSMSWVICRLAHMGFYYANRKSWRSLSFAASLLVLVAMFAVVGKSWL